MLDNLMDGSFADDMLELSDDFLGDVGGGRNQTDYVDVVVATCECCGKKSPILRASNLMNGMQLGRCDRCHKEGMLVETGGDLVFKPGA